ncbi:45 kDa calcium-binding protein [Ixodes scapularis]
MVTAIQQPVLGAASSNLAVACFVSVVVSCWSVPLQPNATRSFRSLTERNVRDKVTDFNRSRFANVKLDQLNASVIKPPDHLEGLPMERDGQLNPKYRKEVLLGAQASAEDQDDALLRSVYSKADENQDGQLSIKELEKWIAAKVKEHYSQAVRDNFWIFSALDKNHDGRVSWDEYHVNFMLEKGFDDNYAKHHPEDHKGLERSVKEKILLDKASWFEAANSDPDALNIDEFLTFRHPEHSHVSLLKMVNDIISNLGANCFDVSPGFLWGAEERGARPRPLGAKGPGGAGGVSPCPEVDAEEAASTLRFESGVTGTAPEDGDLDGRRRLSVDVCVPVETIGRTGPLRTASA